MKGGQKRKRNMKMEIIIRAEAPSKEAQKFARELVEKIARAKRKYFPDTTIKLGKLM